MGDEDYDVLVFDSAFAERVLLPWLTGDVAAASELVGKAGAEQPTALRKCLSHVRTQFADDSRSDKQALEHIAWALTWGSLHALGSHHPRWEQVSIMFAYDGNLNPLCTEAEATLRPLIASRPELGPYLDKLDNLGLVLPADRVPEALRIAETWVQEQGPDPDYEGPGLVLAALRYANERGLGLVDADLPEPEDVVDDEILLKPWVHPDIARRRRFLENLRESGEAVSGFAGMAMLVGVFIWFKHDDKLGAALAGGFGLGILLLFVFLSWSSASRSR